MGGSAYRLIYVAVDRNCSFLPCGLLRSKRGKRRDREHKHVQDESSHVFYNLTLEVAYDYFCHTSQSWYQHRKDLHRSVSIKKVEIIRGPSY